MKRLARFGLIAVAAVAPAAESQIVRGRITEVNTTTPVAGAVVSLLPPAGDSAVVSTLSNRDGEYAVRRAQCEEAARRLDRLHLEFVGGGDGRFGGQRAGGGMVGACAAGDAGPERVGLGGAQGAFDEFAGGGPVNAHATLGGVHRFGEVETLVPEELAETERRVPVDGGARVPRGPLAEGVGDDMGRGEGRAGEGDAGGARDEGRAGEAVGFESAGIGGEGEHRSGPVVGPDHVGGLLADHDGRGVGVA